jgi:hypothetical protein
LTIFRSCRGGRLSQTVRTLYAHNIAAAATQVSVIFNVLSTWRAAGTGARSPLPPHRLTEPDLDEIEELARTSEAEAYRGPLLAQVEEVRRLLVALPMSLEPAPAAAGLWTVGRIFTSAFKDSAAESALLFPAHDRFLLHDLNTIDRLRVAARHPMILDDAPDNLQVFCCMCQKN